MGFSLNWLSFAKMYTDAYPCSKCSPYADLIFTKILACSTYLLGPPATFHSFAQIGIICKWKSTTRCPSFHMISFMLQLLICNKIPTTWIVSQGIRFCILNILMLNICNVIQYHHLVLIDFYSVYLKYG